MSYLSNEWNLWRLRRYQREIRKKYADKLAQLRNDTSKTSDDYGELEADLYYEEEASREAINSFYSHRLIEEAARHDVEIPSGKDSWFYQEDGDHYYLNLTI